MNRGYVPIDEGEAEAQPDLPAVTIRLLPADEEQDAEGFPRSVRFEIPSGAGKRKALDEHVQELAQAWIEEAGCLFEAEPKPTWTDTPDGLARTLTYRLTGYLPGPSPC